MTEIIKKRNKYRAIKTVVDGLTFDSKREATRYGQLKLKAKVGMIQGFDRQVPIPIIVEGKLVCQYIADFVVYNNDGTETIEDVKGYTKGVAYQIFNLKKKLLEITTGKKITVII